MSEMFAETESLAADLALAPARLEAEVTAVVSKGALNIKSDWKAAVSGKPHLPYFPASIGYDLHSDGSNVRAEIGPDKAKRQGALGNLVEFGSANNAPGLQGQRALDAEEERFIDALAEVAERALLG